MRNLLLSLSAISLLSLASCSDDPVAPAPDASIRAGSTFTFEHKIYGDTLWTDLAFTDTVTSIVASIDTTFAGQAHAQFLTAVGDTSVYRALATGDIAIYQPAIEIPTTGVSYAESWPVLPIVTKQASLSTYAEDTLVTIATQTGPKQANVRTVVKSGYVGSSSITIEGTAYAVEESFVEHYIRVEVMDFVSYSRVRNVYSYSPKLKTIVARKQKVLSNHNYGPFPNGSESWSVVKFTL